VKRARRIGDVDPQYKAYVQGSARRKSAIFDGACDGFFAGNERECMGESGRHRRDV
jgi:hypothetical protein